MLGDHPLRWEKFEKPEGFWGYSGDANVASIVHRSTDGRWAWRVDGVVTRGIVQGSGARKDAAAARRAAENAWNIWLAATGLIPHPDTYSADPGQSL